MFPARSIAGRSRIKHPVSECYVPRGTWGSDVGLGWVMIVGGMKSRVIEFGSDEEMTCDFARSHFMLTSPAHNLLNMCCQRCVMTADPVTVNFWEKARWRALEAGVGK